MDMIRFLARRSRKAAATSERRGRIRVLHAQLRQRYGGLGIADVLRVCQQEGISTTWEEVRDVMQGDPWDRVRAVTESTR
ncbi:hypothetical protein SZN_20392 [Streptomyces zinciresistens K42]|uniref:Uncharacterized protein n=2 Tax=Streptomyces TaxID=1883 RepID=G2GEZ5_9ACTN|nr:hypothetical protein SZN_20392 [Streptomyces zinciresistens K42]